MSVIPLRARALPGGKLLFVNGNGAFFSGSAAFAKRLPNRQITSEERAFLEIRGHLVDPDDQFALDTHAYNVAERLTRPGKLDYLILVPTLRCNLSCSYCQVSRASEHANGYDWSPEHLAAVEALLDSLDTTRIKIEFQGGEPTLRPDLIRTVINRCERFAERQFVICTNLQCIDDEILELFDRPDVYISTSLDGDSGTHERNRTKSAGASFFANLGFLVERYAPGKISALPTIDPGSPPDIDALIDAFRSLGLTSIFLRPINYQGFARKRHSASREQGTDWRNYYERFIQKLIELNWADRSLVLEETYLSLCLRRIFHPGRDRHVDLRNPNPAGLDYLVIDYDGAVYPTDEARMLTRSRVIDLKLGTLGSDWHGETFNLLNAHATNEHDPACRRCAYQPYCGRDLIDDLARYGRIDLRRTSTEFCRKHLWLFDLIFGLIYDDSPAVQHSLRRWLRLDTEPQLAEMHG